MKLAAIDIGSNASRLLITNVIETANGKTEYIKMSLVRVPLRLGFDVFDKGEISAKKTEDIIKTMKAYKHLIDVYDVQKYKACATSDSTRWRRMIVNWTETNIQLMNDSSRKYIFKTDTVTKTIEMLSRNDTINKYFLNYALPDTAHLVIWGKFKDDSIYVKMKKVDINSFRLVKWRTTWLRNKSTGKMRY